MAYDIQTLCISMIARNRFYATILSKLDKELVTEDVTPIAAVCFNQHGKVKLLYTEQLLNMTLSEAHFVLIHEVLHIFFNHIGRFKEQYEVRPKLCNVATDIAINQLIGEVKPKDILLPSSFPKLNLELEKNAEYYYNKLLEEQKQLEEQYQSKADCAGQGHELWYKVVGTNEHGEKIVSNASDYDVDMSGEIDRLVEKAVAECKDFGKLPRFVLKQIDSIKQKDRYNWKSALRIMVNSVISNSKRLTQKKINKRFVVNDLILAGKKKTKQSKLLVVRDTSGSMYDGKVQQELLNEILSITKHSRVFVCDCDVKIQDMYELKSMQDFRKMSGYKGGGGTNFIEPFIKAKEIGVNGIIYLTDTYGQFPNPADIGMYKHKTIWVTFNEKDAKVPFGRLVNIDTAA